MDTNAAIDLLDGLLPKKAAIWLNSSINSNDVVISVINKIELLGFHASPQTYESLQNLINSIEVLDLADVIVNQTIELKKIKKIKLPDAIIAATALVNNLTIVSRNKSDFKNIDGLKCIDPYTDI